MGDPSITGTGFAAGNIVGITAYQNRLWFVENHSLSVWYLDVLSIAGTATKFDIGPICKLGGYIVAMGSWSRDGGAGPDDLAVFLTNKGEVLIYSITDPTSASTISLLGVFKIPEPVGRRCIIKVGSDLAVITSQGLIPLSSVLGTSEAGQTNSAITDKITSAFRTAYERCGTISAGRRSSTPSATCFSSTCRSRNGRCNISTSSMSAREPGPGSRGSTAAAGR
jgi:hypothetical protein